MDSLNINEVICSAKDKALARARKQYPRHVHRISDIGHPCHRYLYYAIHDWDKRKEVDLSLQAIFKAGNVLENPVISFFNSEVGPLCEPKMTILDTQSQTCDKLLRDHNIEGSRDGTLAVDVDGRWQRLGPIDGKSCSQSSFRMYQDIESLKRHSWSYKYLAQVQLYAFDRNEPVGYLFFYSKQNPFYDWKIIEVPLDYAYIESILKKCEAVNNCLKVEKAPDKLNQPFWCAGCDFESLCLPELVAEGEGPCMNESEELQLLLDRVLELKPAAKEYEKEYDTLKGLLVKGKPLIMRDCMLDWITYDVPEKTKTTKAFTVWKPKITPFADVEDD